MKKFNNSPKSVTAFYFTYSIFANCRYLTKNDYIILSISTVVCSLLFPLLCTSCVSIILSTQGFENKPKILYSALPSSTQQIHLVKKSSQFRCACMFPVPMDYSGLLSKQVVQDAFSSPLCHRQWF